MNLRYKFLYIILILLVIFSITFGSVTSFAEADTTCSNLQIYSPACILLDAKTGTILYEKNSDTPMYPASTTKLMTAILVLENCSLDDVASVSMTATHSVPVSYTIADLQIGEQLTIEQLLNVLLIPSANDAANVLAEHVGGSIENFATMMNEKAVEIGCTNTHFVNPNGVHNVEHISTAHDLALIGKYALKFDVIKKIVMKQTYSLPDKNDGTQRIFKNTNELLKESGKYYYEYASGLKTGYTNAAKSCIIASAKKDDFELIAVVLGGEKTEDFQNMRELDCKTLFEYGFNNCNLQELYDAYEKTLIQNSSNSPIIAKVNNGNMSFLFIGLIILFFMFVISNAKSKKKKRKCKKRKRNGLYDFRF